jgi:hypothetical protein
MGPRRASRRHVVSIAAHCRLTGSALGRAVPQADIRATAARHLLAKTFVSLLPQVL